MIASASRFSMPDTAPSFAGGEDLGERLARRPARRLYVQERRERRREVVEKDQPVVAPGPDAGPHDDERDVRVVRERRPVRRAGRTDDPVRLGHDHQIAAAAGHITQAHRAEDRAFTEVYLNQATRALRIGDAFGVFGPPERCAPRHRPPARRATPPGSSIRYRRLVGAHGSACFGERTA